MKMVVLFALAVTSATAQTIPPADPCLITPPACATVIQTHATSHARLPNTAVDVTVGLSASGKDLVSVERTLAANAAKLTGYLQTQQVQRIITTSVSFRPATKSEWSGLDKTVGYNGSSRVSFRTTPAKVADIYAGVLVNGANQIDSTQFTPTEDEIAQAQRRLAAEATRTALTDAAAVANAATMRVVATRKINVATGTGDQADRFRGGGLEDLAGYAGKLRSTSPLETVAGDFELTVRVDVEVAATPTASPNP